MMVWKRTTGISMITLPREICPSGLIAGSNNQRRHCQVGTLPEFTSIFGRYIGNPVTTWVTMQCNRRQLLMAMPKVRNGRQLLISVPWKYAVLKTLPDKIAWFLYEFNNGDYL
jgi:hypothetical protein